VQDTGIGIPEERQEAIFDSFSQADSSTSRKFGGTGLGLTICKNLVNLMNGEIWVKSITGYGSTFYFTSRFMASVSNVKKAIAIPDKIHGLKILVVDDNKTNRVILKEILRSFGFVADLYESAESALEAFQTGERDKYDLIISDYQMPGMNGFDFLTEVRKTSNVPAIVLTSVGAKGEKQMFKQLENLIYLTKPAKQSVLFDSIIELMGLSVNGEGKKANKQECYNFKRLHALPASTRILVAEDNFINQRVIAALMQKTNLVTDVVGDGTEALAALQKTEYQLVLMDVQMPKMDGLTATREIRQALKMGKLPIIAMTANAMKGDREICLVAGMNDYISKPIAPFDLYRMLETWLLDKK